MSFTGRCQRLDARPGLHISPRRLHHPSFHSRKPVTSQSQDQNQSQTQPVDVPPLPPIVQAGTPVLRQPARPVPPELFGSLWLHSLVDTMVAVMRAAPGVGLAAPQIGEPWQVIVLEDRPEYIARTAATSRLPPATLAEMDRRPFGPLTLVNPVQRPRGQEGAMFFEGCLSVRGYTALVPRYRCVEVAAVSPEGQPLELTAEGWQARILQHECDHLKGILYVDRMLPRSLSTTDNLAQWLGSLPEDLPPMGRCTCCHPIDRAGN